MSSTAPTCLARSSTNCLSRCHRSSFNVSIEKPIRTGPFCAARVEVVPVVVSCGAVTHAAATSVQLAMTMTVVRRSLRIDALLAGFDSMMRGRMFVDLRATIALILLTGCATPRVLFDDFNYSRPQDLAAHGWIIRSETGFPGVPGATWGT